MHIQLLCLVYTTAVENLSIVARAAMFKKRKDQKRDFLVPSEINSRTIINASENVKCNIVRSAPKVSNQGSKLEAAS